MCLSALDSFSMKNGGEVSTRRWIFGLLLNPFHLCGLTLVVNLLFLVFLFPFVNSGLGNLDAYTHWWNWESSCKKCLKPGLTWEKGIFCANFGTTRGGFSDCEGAWCGECFGPHPLNPKIVAEPIDFNGRPLTVPDDKNRFMSARDGDHTLTPFQCPICQCRNIKRQNLIPNVLVKNSGDTPQPSG